MRKYTKKGFLLVYALLFVLILNGCTTKYTNETDPHTYLEFRLLEDNTYGVTGFSGGFVQHVTIPSMHEGIPVTRVMSYAFIQGESFFGIPPKHLPIDTLVIEEGITHIEEFAFESNGILNAQLPDSLVYVGDHAFSSNYGALINLPENLTYIGEGAFAQVQFDGVVHIKDIEIGALAFYQAGITSVTFEEGIETIPYGMFSGVVNLESIELPQSLVSIGPSAFEGTTNLREISFPESLIEIGELAFHGSGLTTLTLNSQMVIQEGAFWENMLLTEVSFNHPEIILGEDAFGYNPLLNDVHYHALAKGDDTGFQVVIGESFMEDFSMFKSIGADAFYGREFNDLHIPSNIIYIHPYAFAFSKFKNLTIDALEIRQYAFYYAVASGTVEITSEMIHSESFNNATGFNH